MRFKSLQYLITGTIICCLMLSCNPNQQGTAAAPSATRKVSDSLVLPVTVIVTDDGIEGRLSDSIYPKTYAIEGLDTAATPIAVYGAARMLWLGPKGYTGHGASGANGSVLISLYPPEGSTDKAPYITYQAIPACVGCMMMAASPFFENAKADLLSNFDSAMLALVHIPQNLVIQKRSATLVTYTYTEKGEAVVTGVACYTSLTQGNNGEFQQAEFALGPDKKALTDLLVKRYISMWGLK